jgi:photosystem II stability/assembly factor-like uncharacterized protein
MSHRNNKHANRQHQKLRQVGNTVFLGVALSVLVVGFAAIVAFQSLHFNNVATGAPTKPSGPNPYPTEVNYVEAWHTAQGLPKNVMKLVFSRNSPAVGYASVFVNKTTQALYKTTDEGLSWHAMSNVTSLVGDIVATSPTDMQDVIQANAYAPSAGTYSIQRSYDGGQTWQTQTTTLPSSATVMRTGWSGSTFIVSFSLDRQPTGDSALVAFPAKQPSFHLDSNGKIDGISMMWIQVLAGQGGSLQVWGLTNGSAKTLSGLFTPDMGKTWTALSYSATGKAVFPIATTDDGDTLLAANADRSQLFVSQNGGKSWTAYPSLGSAHVQLDHTILVGPDGQPFIHVDSDRDSGTHAVNAGQWQKVTGHDIIAISTDATNHTNRLWAYDSTGEIVWRDR